MKLKMKLSKKNMFEYGNKPISQLLAMINKEYSYLPKTPLQAIEMIANIIEVEEMTHDEELAEYWKNFDENLMKDVNK